MREGVGIDGLVRNGEKFDLMAVLVEKMDLILDASVFTAMVAIGVVNKENFHSWLSLV